MANESNITFNYNNPINPTFNSFWPPVQFEVPGHFYARQFTPNITSLEHYYLGQPLFYAKLPQISGAVAELTPNSEETSDIPVPVISIHEPGEIIDITTPPSTPTKPISSAKRGNTKDNTRKYQCTACVKYFPTRFTLRNHFVTKVHKRVVKRKGVQDPAEDTSTWVNWSYRCAICGIGTNRLKSKIDHICYH